MTGKTKPADGYYAKYPVVLFAIIVCGDCMLNHIINMNMNNSNDYKHCKLFQYSHIRLVIFVCVQRIIYYIMPYLSRKGMLYCLVGEAV